MTNILFAKTPWGYPILGVSGNVECVKYEIEGNGADLGETLVPMDFIKSQPDGLYVWIGEYLWDGEWGPHIKTRSVGLATADDMVGFAFAIGRMDY